MSLGAQESASASIGVTISDVTRRFGAVAAVERVSLSAEPGSFVALIGPSGCGKTTLLRMIGGLDRPDRGSIDFPGMPGAEEARAESSFCFQEPRLLPWRTALENVALPLELARQDGRAAALAALDRVHLTDAALRRPHQLSGGMRMRVALARTLVTRPRLVLLDEPFSSLDEVTRQELGEELHALWRQDRFTAVLVTHSIPEAVYLATRCVVLSPRPARVLHVEEISLPRHDPDVRTSSEFNEHVRRLSAVLRGAMRGEQP
ncbi:MAG: ABC transporter ATP-binding protein [Phycisphaerae bacterium]|jgi:NitT/TauT family transport system ATP-binding protein|nr:ABC transporter ATP-binding protein [Phycisphaerae bacterium]